MSKRSLGWREGLQAALNRDETGLFRFTDTESAANLQDRLALLVSEETPHGFHPSLVCGLDASYSNGTGIGVAAVWDLEKSQVVKVESHEAMVQVDHVSGFFGFREGPLVLAAAGNLSIVPDVFLVDGHGRSHPRRFGLACHVVWPWQGLPLALQTVSTMDTGEELSWSGLAGRSLAECLPVMSRSCITSALDI